MYSVDSIFLQKKRILRTPGVHAIVGTPQPEPVDETELEQVRQLVTSGRRVEPWPYLKTGTVVQVLEGPLRGVEGILVKVKDEFRVVVSITMLQRSVAVVLERDQIEPVANPIEKLARAVGQGTMRPVYEFGQGVPKSSGPLRSVLSKLY